MAQTTRTIGWHKSSYSNDSGACVEVGAADDIVGVRDTKDRSGGTLAFGHDAWSAFTDSIKDGRLDS